MLSKQPAMIIQANMVKPLEMRGNCDSSTDTKN